MSNYRLNMLSELENLDRASLWLREQKCLNQLSRIEQFQVELCMVEVITNVINHAYGGRPGQQLEIICMSTRDMMTLRFVDSGKPMMKVPDPVLPETTANSGRGWFILYSFMDEAVYYPRSNLNVTILTKYLIAASA